MHTIFYHIYKNIMILFKMMWYFILWNDLILFHNKRKVIVPYDMIWLWYHIITYTMVQYNMVSYGIVDDTKLYHMTRYCIMQYDTVSWYNIILYLHLQISLGFIEVSLGFIGVKRRMMMNQMIVVFRWLFWPYISFFYPGDEEVVHLTGDDDNGSSPSCKVSNPCHLFTICGKTYDKAEIKQESVWIVAKDCRVEINNGKDSEYM